MTANVHPDKQQGKEKWAVCPEFGDQGKLPSELPSNSCLISYTNNVKMNCMCMCEK